MSMHMQNFVKFHIFLKILSGSELRTPNKGHNSIINGQKVAFNNPYLDLDNTTRRTKAYTNLGHSSSFRSQDIERNVTDGIHG